VVSPGALPAILLEDAMGTSASCGLPAITFETTEYFSGFGHRGFIVGEAEAPRGTGCRIALESWRLFPRRIDRKWQTGKPHALMTSDPEDMKELLAGTSGLGILSV
jgi:hypothetical protein